MFLLASAFVRALKAPPIAPSALSDKAQGPSLGPRGPSGLFGDGAALRAAFGEFCPTLALELKIFNHSSLAFEVLWRGIDV